MQTPGPVATPRPPYHAVVFTSVRDEQPGDGYGVTAARMEQLAAAQPGFLGIESARGPDGLGITVSYWATAEAAGAWGRDAEHRLVQQLGRDKWYRWYSIRFCQVERAHDFTRPGGDQPEAPASGPTEAGPAFDRTVIGAYEAGAAKLRAAVAGLTRDELTARPGPGDWSVQEVVVHLADSDAISIDRMKRILTEDDPPLLYADETAYIARLHPHDQDPGDALALFEISRRQWARVLRFLPDEAFRRTGRHNRRGPVTLGGLVGDYVEHADYHLGFIHAKRERLGKPVAGFG